MSEREFICVTCPVGCTIRARLLDGEVQAEGQACRQGIAFVREEMTAPRRMLTTTVRVEGGEMPLLPVRTAAPIPKDRLLAVAAHLRSVVVRAPVAEHQVVVKDVLGTGVDVIASRSLPRAEEPAAGGPASPCPPMA